MASEQITVQFVEHINSIVSIGKDVGKDRLIRRDEWGTITFENVEVEIEFILWMAEELIDLPFFYISEPDLVEISNHLSRAKDLLASISNFRLDGNINSERNKIEDGLRGEVQSLSSSMGTWLPLLTLKAGKFENLGARVAQINREAESTLEKTKSDAQAGLDEIRKSVEAARAAAGEAGAAEFTHEFRAEADRSARRSALWLIPAGASALAALGLSVWLMLDVFGPPPDRDWLVAYQLGGRAAAISVLFYAAIWTGRIALANMHLASVNRHRATSLQTLQAFHRAAGDPVTKDAVVLEAARAVYENVVSGYVSRSAAVGSGGGRTLELIKNVTQPSPGDKE